MDCTVVPQHQSVGKLIRYETWTPSVLAPKYCLNSFVAYLAIMLMHRWNASGDRSKIDYVIAVCVF